MDSEIQLENTSILVIHLVREKKYIIGLIGKMSDEVTSCL